MTEDLQTKARTIVERAGWRPEDQSHLTDDISAALHAAYLAGETARRELDAKAVPTNWCDSLLTGKDAPKLPLDGPDVEKLLIGIRDRILSHKLEKVG